MLKSTPSGGQGKVNRVPELNNYAKGNKKPFDHKITEMTRTTETYRAKRSSNESQK